MGRGSRLRGPRERQQEGAGQGAKAGEALLLGAAVSHALPPAAETRPAAARRGPVVLNNLSLVLAVKAESYADLTATVVQWDSNNINNSNKK